MTTSLTTSTGAASPTAADIEPGLIPESPTDRERRRVRPPLSRSLFTGVGLVGSILVLGIVALALVAPVLTSYGPDQQIDGAYLLPPSADHWFGTDDLNRDVATRVLYGIRVDLLIIFISVPIGAVLGTLIGVLTVSHPVSDVIAQRTFDVILAFPALVLGIALTAVCRPGRARSGSSSCSPRSPSSAVSPARRCSGSGNCPTSRRRGSAVRETSTCCVGTFCPTRWSRSASSSRCHCRLRCSSKAH